MERARRGLLAVLKLLCIVLFTILVVVVVWQVFTRQVLQNPSAWTTVTAQYMFVWLSLFGFTLVFGERGHIAVDFLAERMPPAVRRVLAAAVQLSILVFAVLVMVWGGIRGTAASWDQTVPGFAFSVGQMYLALPVAGAMIAVLSLADLIRAIRGQDLSPLEVSEEEAVLAAPAAATEHLDPGHSTGGSSAAPAPAKEA